MGNALRFSPTTCRLGGGEGPDPVRLRTPRPGVPQFYGFSKSELDALEPAPTCCTLNLSKLYVGLLAIAAYAYYCYIMIQQLHNANLYVLHLIVCLDA